MYAAPFAAGTELPRPGVPADACPAQPLHSSHVLQFREEGSAHWAEHRTVDNAKTLHGLRPETTYEYRVSAGCGSSYSSYSALFRLRTPPPPEPAYECGTLPPAFDLSNREPATGLKRGDLVAVNDFTMVLGDFERLPNGLISGRGVIAVPMFNNARMRVEFKGILVNTDHRMVDGMVAGSREVWDIDSDSDLGNGSESGGTESDGEGTEGSGSPLVTDSVMVSGLDSVLVLGDSLVLVVSNGGLDTARVALGENGLVVTDPETGEQVTVNGDGSTSDTSGGGAVSNGTGTGHTLTTNLDSIVHQAIVRLVMENDHALDSLRREMKPTIEKIEKLIEDNYFYPPRIRGNNDELISEGISKYIGTIDKGEETEKRLGPAIMELDKLRNGLVAIDRPIQMAHHSNDYLNGKKEPEKFRELVESIKNGGGLPDQNPELGLWVYEKIKTLSHENEDE